MSEYQNITLHQKFLHGSNFLSLSVIIVGLLVLTGWQFDLNFLKRPIPGLVAMNPLTAALFVMCGFCVYQCGRAHQKNIKSNYLILIALLIFLISGIKFISSFTFPDFPVDTFIYSEKIKNEVFGNTPNRMAPNTAFNFVLIGFVLLLVNYENAKSKLAFQIIALIVFLISLLSLLGYMYQVKSFYGIPSFIPMAVHTALTFIILSLSLLFLDPDKGLMQNFTGDYAGSTSARLLIPVAIITPILLGYLRLLGDWSGLYSKEFGVVILILSTIIIFLIIIWWNASVLNKKDALRKVAEDNLKLLNARLESEVETKTMAAITNEKRFQSMIENSADVISLMDEQNNFIYINPSVQKITGYSPEEFTSIKYSDLVHPEDREKSKETLIKTIKNPGIPINKETRLIHKNGKTVWVEGTITNLINEENIKAIVLNFSDISVRKESEIKLIKSEKLFRSIVLNIPNSLVIVLDKTHNFVMIEGDIMEQLGYKKQDYEGKHPRDVDPNYEKSKPLYDRLMNGEHFSMESSSERGDYMVHFVPIKDEKGEVESGMMVALEVSEIKKAQKEIAELNRDLEKKVYIRTEQLETVNKELESFSYSVSHDLRAPLRAINGYAKMIEEDYGKALDQEGNRLLSTIQYNARRMGNLIDDLLSFSRLGRKEINKSQLDMIELVAGSINELNKTVVHTAEIKVEKLVNSKGDYSLINQVFYNLIANAIKYSSKKEHPIITISSEIKEDQVVYCVNDNGAGFNMKYADKLFGVFQRLHSTDEFEGIGVGLAIVQRIVTKHGGKVWAKGEINKGASFYFSLPFK